MGFFDRLFTDKKAATKTVAQELSSVRRVSPLYSSYENLFAQVRPLVDAMKVVRPYGVGKNGARLSTARTPELNLLDSPNAEMGWAEFADLLFSTWLTEREVNIHVWKTGNRVAGYTVLPVGCRTRQADGSNLFQVSTLNNGTIDFYDDDVMTIRYSRSPRNMDAGVSPATSVEVYAQIDDLMAQYQKAFIENGATPASITFITASTKEKYDAKRNKMEMGLGGASNKNKTLYVWRQMLDDGQSADEVEVKPIQGDNSTLAIKEIIDIVNDHLNKSVGVSNFILGDDSSAKYDNAELSNNQFITRRVYPALMMFWSIFQHELDRITGGLGYGISFDLEIPELTERQQVKSEIHAKDSATLIELVKAGADPIGAVNALGLGDEWKSVAVGISSKTKEAQELERMNLTASKAVEPTQVDNLTAKTVKTPEKASEHESGHVCCTSYDDYSGEVVFAENEKAEKKIFDVLRKLAEKELLNRYPDLTRAEVEDAINDLLKNKAILGMEDGATGLVGAVNDTVIAGKISAVENWTLTPEFEADLEQRTRDVVGKYIEFCDDEADAIKLKGQEQNWTAGRLMAELKKELPTFRAEMIARNETVHAFRAGGVENVKNLAEKYDLNAYLVWHVADSHACAVCMAMDGKRVKAGDAFPTHVTLTDEDTGEITDVDWGSYYNDNGAEPNAHCNCRCYFTTEVD